MKTVTLTNFYAMGIVIMCSTLAIALEVLGLSQHPGWYLFYGVVGGAVTLVFGFWLDWREVKQKPFEEVAE